MLRAVRERLILLKTYRRIRSLWVEFSQLANAGYRVLHVLVVFTTVNVCIGRQKRRFDLCAEIKRVSG